MTTRRFQLSDGKSDKFWEITVSGASFDVRFGRIGTNGQAQTKPFSSDAAAAQESSKLIREKIAKGYIEVACATPTPTPTPTPDPADARTPHGLLWTPETRVRRRPRRSHGVRRDLSTDALEHLRAFCMQRRPAIAGGATFSDEKYARLQSEVLAPFDDGARLSPEAAGAASVLLMSRMDPRAQLAGRSLGALLVDGWLELGGPGYLVSAAAASTSFSCFADPEVKDAIVLGPHVVIKGLPQFAHTEQGGIFWEAVRERISTMPEEAYEAAYAEAQKLFADGSSRVKVRLAFAFPDERAWTSEAARIVLAAGDIGHTPMALASVSDRAEVDSLLSLLAGYHDRQAYAAFDIVDALGVDADVPLVGIADAARRMHWGGDDALATALDALTVVPTMTVAEWLVRYLVDKRIAPTAAAFFSAAPALAFATIAPLAAARKASMSAAAILANAVRAAPDQARDALPTLDDRAAKIVRGLLEENAPVEEATLEELPSVLATPPWASGTKKAKKNLTVFDLRTLPFEEYVDWSGLTKPAALSTATADKEDALIQAIDQRIANNRDVYLWEIHRCTDAVALQLLRRVPPELWWSFNLAQDVAIHLARFDVAAVDACLEIAKKKSTDAIIALEALISPRLAPFMADVLVRVRRARRIAERWLARHPEVAAIGLLPYAFGPPGKQRENACRALRFLVARGHRDTLENVARKYDDSCARALGDVLGAADLVEGAPSKPPKMPQFFDPRALPRPRLVASKKALPLDAVRRLGEMLAFCDPVEPYVGLEHVREACDADSLGSFAWALFEAWGLAGYVASEKWAFFALGWLGRDEHAHALAACIRAWPTEGAFARAVLGLDVLAMMQSDAALMLIHGISQKVKSRPLLEKAREKMDSLAEALGLTAEELGDRLVPDLGLEADGSRVLDFGPRTFHVGFDEHFAPFVRDADGARLKDLPKPGTNDDPERAADASNEWKALKKVARSVAAQQVTRFESAMVARRRWDAEAFRTYVVDHPLVGQLVRRLVLAAYDASGKLLGTFRIAEDGSYANEKDEAFEVRQEATVGVVHPLELDPALLAIWGDRFADYEIVQPFAQLGRDVPRNITLGDFVSFPKADTLKLLGLERRGWKRGAVGDGGMIDSFEKEVGALRAVLSLDPGIYAGDPKINPEQTPRDLSFGEHMRGEVSSPDPIFIAEVAADLRAVGALG